MRVWTPVAALVSAEARLTHTHCPVRCLGLLQIGFKACNDAFILRSCVQFILKKYFEDNSKLYMELSELFREVQ